MIKGEKYALSIECVPNNEVFRIFTYHSVIRSQHVNMQREHERQGDVANDNTRSRAQLGERHMWLPRVRALCLDERLSFHADVGNAHGSYTMLYR